MSVTTCRSTHVFRAYIYSKGLHTVSVCLLTSYHLVPHLAGTNMRPVQMPGKHRFPLVCVKIVYACVSVHGKSSSVLFPSSFLSAAGLIAVSGCDNAPSLSTLISECGPADSIQTLAGTAPCLSALKSF